MQRAIAADRIALAPRWRHPLSWAALALGGCSIVMPVPEHAQRGALSPRLSPAAAAASNPVAAAEHGADCAPPSHFAGDLDLAICRVDARRLAYLRESADVLNQTAAYNSLLWPLGAVALYEKLRGAPNRNLLLPGALAVGAQGFMNAGVPERQQQYLRAARRLGCAIVASGADLVRLDEVDRGWNDPAAPLPPLGSAVGALRAALAAYEQERTRLIATLEPRPATRAAAAPRLTFEAARAALAGASGGGGGSKGADSRLQFATETAARMTAARAELKAGQALLQRLTSGRAASALLFAAVRVDDDLQQGIALKAAPPADPASVAASLLAGARSLLRLQADAGSAPVHDPLDMALPPGLDAGLHGDSVKALSAFQTGKAVPLQAALRDVVDWRARHDELRREVDRLLVEGRCESTPTLVAATAAPVPSPAPRAGTSNTLPPGTPLP